MIRRPPSSTPFPYPTLSRSPRIRPTAETLLFLAGKTSPPRHAEPVAFVDVIRAAIGEVEEYRRVELRRIDGGYLSGAAVADVAHIIAELVENGLAFSPPELNVEIYGRWIGFQYLIAIVDQGVGMSNQDLAVANARLRGEEHFLVGPAKFIGHFVAGRISQDLGAAVQLAHSPVTGVTARLVLPASIVGSSLEWVRTAQPASSSPAEGARVPIGPEDGDIGIPAVPVGPPLAGVSAAPGEPGEPGEPAQHPVRPAP